MDEQHVYNEGQFRLFVDLPSLHKAGTAVEDGWYPFLPKPGKYSHPIYGTVEISREGNQALVDSVVNKVYQEHIPIDAEHQTKLSGAVAWLKDMRMNEDGSADGYFEWTHRGRLLVQGGQFKYFSPEFFGSWPDPATGVVHRNVVAGGAITTRPFFKDKVLRALVASEDGAEVIQQETFADMKKCEDCGQDLPEGFSGTMCASCSAKGKKAMSDPIPTPTPEDTQQMNEAVIQAKIDEAVAAARQAFTEEQASKFAELATRLEAAETLAASEKTAREQIQSQLEAREAADQERRFRELVTGKGGSSDGAAWIGDPEKNVLVLKKLAATFGEDSEDFRAFVEAQTTQAAAAASILFKEIGSSTSGPAAGSAEAKVEAMAREHAKAHNMTYEQAYAEVLETPEGKQLYSQL